MNKITYCFPLIFACVAFNTAAQVSLKTGLRGIGNLDFSILKAVDTSLQVVKNPYIFLGIICYSFSLVFWIACLSRVELSYAYPLTSLGYVFTALIGFLLFQENLSLTRLLGIVVIMIGVYILSQS